MFIASSLSIDFPPHNRHRERERDREREFGNFKSCDIIERERERERE